MAVSAYYTLDQIEDACIVIEAENQATIEIPEQYFEGY